VLLGGGGIDHDVLPLQLVETCNLIHFRRHGI
jgi:hypothetical protein